MAGSDSDSREQEIDNVIAEFLQAEQVGVTFDALAWLARNKHLQPELSNFLQDRSRFSSALRELADARDDAADGFVAGELFDGLQIMGLLKSGGMGRVYVGWQLGLERPVAIKTLRRKENARVTLEGFQEEGRKLVVHHY